METRFIPQEFIYPDSRLNQLSWGRLTEVQKHDEATDWLATHKDLIRWLVNQYRTNVVITKADLFQEAMLAAWEAFDNYDSNRVDVLLETYLFVVMDNAIKEVFRRVFAQKRQASWEVITLGHSAIIWHLPSISWWSSLTRPTYMLSLTCWQR